MKKITIILAASILSAASVFATAANFTVNVGHVFADSSTAIDKSNGASFTAVGILGDISSVDTSSLSAFQSGISSLTTGTLSLVPIPAIPDVWLSAVDAGVAGAPASLLIYNNSDSNNWGVISSSTFETLALGTAPLSFKTNPHKFDTAVVGTYEAVAGAFTLVSVPEPSSAALLAGMLALGSVMLRRRAA